MASFPSLITLLARTSGEVALVLQELGTNACEWAQELEESNRRDRGVNQHQTRTAQDSIHPQSSSLHNHARPSNRERNPSETCIFSSKNQSCNEKGKVQKSSHQQCMRYTFARALPYVPQPLLKVQCIRKEQSFMSNPDRVTKNRNVQRAGMKKNINVLRRNWSTKELGIVFSTIITHYKLRENSLIGKIVDALGNVMTHEQVRVRFRNLLVSGIVRTVDVGTIENGANVEGNDEMQATAWVLRSEDIISRKKIHTTDWDTEGENAKK